MAVMRDILVAGGGGIVTVAALWVAAQLGGFAIEVLIPDLPGDAVVAFEGKCPEGWSPYSKAEGRFILGVGKGPLKKAVFREEPGGEEEVTLTVDGMPEHRHGLYFAGAYLKAGNTEQAIHGNPESLNVTTEPAGRGQPHNNMPPYIALYFCKKD